MASRSRSRSPTKQNPEETCNDRELHETESRSEMENSCEKGDHLMSSQSRSSSPSKQKTEETCNDSKLLKTESRSNKENTCEKGDHLMFSRSRSSSPIKQKTDETCNESELHETESRSNKENTCEKGDHLMSSQSRSSSPSKQKTEETCNDIKLLKTESRSNKENTCEKGDHLMSSQSRSSSPIKQKTEEPCNESELHETESRSNKENSSEKGDHLMPSRSRSCSPFQQKTEEICNDSELHETKSRSSRENSSEKDDHLMPSRSRSSSPIKQKTDETCNESELHETESRSNKENSSEKGDHLMPSRSRSCSPFQQKTEEICNDSELHETKSRSSRENSSEKDDHLMPSRSRSSSPIKQKTEEICNDSELHETKSRSSRENSSEKDDHLMPYPSRSSSPIKQKTEEMCNDSVLHETCERDDYILQNLCKKFGLTECKSRNRLFITNIPLTWTKDDVLRCLKSSIEKFQIPQSHLKLSLDIKKVLVEGTLKNCCTVLFKTRRAYVLAYHQLKNVEVEGKRLEVIPANQIFEIEEANTVQENQYSNSTDVEKQNTIVNPTEPVVSTNFIIISRKFPNPTETYGLSLQFLSSLGIKPPLCPRIIILNLAPNVTEAKIKEVFSLAGVVLDVGVISTDKSNKAIVNYDHPLEAVQAISMFNGQSLYGWAMQVEMDRSKPGYKLRLPRGLAGVGPGLGPLGDVLRKARGHADLLSLRQLVRGLADKHPRTKGNSNARDHSPWDTGSNPNPGNSLDTNTQILNLLQALVKQQTSTPPAAPVQYNMQSTPPMVQHNIQAPAPMAQHSIQAPPLMVQPCRPMQTIPPMNQHNMQALPSMVQQNIQTTPPMNQYNMQAAPFMVQHNMHASAPSVQHNMQTAPPMNQYNTLATPPRVHNIQASAPSASLEKPTANTMIQYPVHHKTTGAGQQGKPQAPYSDAGSSNEYCHGTGKWDQLEYNKKDSTYEPSSKRAKVEDTSKHSKLILIRYLPPYVTLEALKEKMSEVGKLDFVEMTGHGKAILRFKSQREAETCIQLFDRSKVDGQVIEVKYF